MFEASEPLSTSRIALRSVLVVLVVALAMAGAGALGGTQASGRQGPEPARLAGADRFATAVEISRHQFPEGAAEVYLANADRSPDALAGGSLTGGPVLLVSQCGALPDVVVEELLRLAPQRVVALGGPAAVAPEVLDQAVTGEVSSSPCSRQDGGQREDGVFLEVAQPQPEYILLTLVNQTEGEVEYGRDIVLERRVDGSYEPLDPPVGPWTDEALYLPSGGRSGPDQIGPDVVRDGKWRPLEPGDYRVSKEVDLPVQLGGGRETLSTTFTIGND